MIEGHDHKENRIFVAVDPAKTPAAVVWLTLGDGAPEPILDLSYPRPLPPHPGPKPRWFRRRALREWERARAQRQHIKRMNFVTVYGSRVPRKNNPNEVSDILAFLKGDTP